MSLQSEKNAGLMGPSYTTPLQKQLVALHDVIKAATDVKNTRESSCGRRGLQV